MKIGEVRSVSLVDVKNIFKKIRRTEPFLRFLDISTDSMPNEAASTCFFSPQSAQETESITL